MVAVAAGLLFAGNANAQVAIHAGYSPEQWANENHTTDFHSYFLGVDFLVPIVADLNVSVGFQGRWSTESGEDSQFVFDTNHRTNVVGVEIPVLLNYRFKLTDELSITPFVGPKFAYYIKGRTRNSSDHPIYEWFDEENEASRMNRFNVSATMGVAFSFTHFHLYGGYNTGLSDMDNNERTKTVIGGPFVGLAVGF